MLRNCELLDRLRLACTSTYSKFVNYLPVKWHYVSTRPSVTSRIMVDKYEKKLLGIKIGVTQVFRNVKDKPIAP